MALVVHDRVKETSTTTGTGTLNLGGAVSGFESFVAAIGNSNTTYYAITASNGDFEVGLGTVTDATPDTLARTTVITSSNSNNAVNFSAGTKDVFCTMPASKSVIEDANNHVTLPHDLFIEGGLIDLKNDGGAVSQIKFYCESSNAHAQTLIGAPHSVAATNTLTLPGGSTIGNSAATLVSDIGTQTLTNKTLTSPVINTGVSGSAFLDEDNMASNSATQFASQQSIKAYVDAQVATVPVGDITSVVAGTNLSGGGTSGDVTLNLADASTSAKGAASFSSDNFAASSGAITIKDLGIATAEIQNDAVTQAKIGDDAVGADQLAADAVVTASIVNSNVTVAKMAANSVDSDQYVDGSIDTAHIANAQITNALMADDAIDTAQIADNAVSLAKMASGTDGNIISFDASGNPVAVATGSSGQVLTSAGAGAVPSFQTPTVGDITSVVAGSGLTGGGTSGDVTLNVGAGTGIDVAADAISVDVSDFMANGSNNRIVTATGADAQNAEANLTFDGSTLAVSGALTTTGNITVDHVLPQANDTYDLGADGNVWRHVYTGDLHLTNEAKAEGNAVDGTKGNWTIQEGAEHLFILNNKSGKKYRFELKEM
tara:strand:+ start:3752 stop:5557 length:1806 start_codon:yes stop_codon:yes gene_type:complete